MDYNFDQIECDDILSKSTLIGYFRYDNLIRCFYHYNDLPIIIQNITHINYQVSTFIPPNNCKELKDGVFISDKFIDKFNLCGHITQNDEYEHLMFDDINYSMKIDSGAMIITESIYYDGHIIVVLPNIIQGFNGSNLDYIKNNL